VRGVGAITSFLAVLTHHDDGCLKGSERRQHQVQQNVGIGSKGCDRSATEFRPIQANITTPKNTIEVATAEAGAGSPTEL